MAGSSKVAMRSLLRGSGHLGKEATKFQFDLTVERVHGLHTGPHTIKWTRGAKVAYTKPFQVERRSKESLNVGQKISLLCTLYRSKNHSNGNAYDAKDSKISLVSLKDGKKNEKTTGKIHFNIAEYAGVPSSVASVKFRLNSKVRVELSIACTFVQVSKGPGSSAGSGLSGLTVSSGDPDPEPEKYDSPEEDTCEDLEEILSPVTPEAKTPFECAKAVFSGENNRENAGDVDAGTVMTAFSKFSSSNTEEQMTGPPADSGTDRMSGKALNRRGSSQVRSRRKAKLGALENENEGLRQEVARCKKELETCKQLNQVSEEVIVELRQALSRNELELKNYQMKQRGALKKKTVEVNEEIKAIETRASQEAEDYEERLNSLRVQVESLGRAKKRIEEDLQSAREERDALQKGVLGATPSESAPEAETELRQVRARCDVAESKLNAELARRRGLEQKCEDLDNEVCRLRSKVRAHEEHSVQSKQTYEELSVMYGELREQHKRIQQELQLSRDGSGNVEAQNSGDRSDSDRNRFSRRRNRTEQRVRREENNEFAAEVETVRMALQDAKRKIVHLQTEKGESDRQCLNLSADLELLQGRFEKSQNERSKLCKEYELMKAKFFETCEKLEENDRKIHGPGSRQTDLDAMSLISSSFNNQSGHTISSEWSHAAQQKIMKVVSSALEAKRTIQKLRADLQAAYDREERNEMEVRRLKRVTDEMTKTIKLAFDRETARREQVEEELEKALSREEKAKSSVEAMIEKEMIYREEIRTLERAVENLHEKVEATRDSSSIAISASRQELKLIQDELQTASLRTESLERELCSKREIAENLTTRVRELELEIQVIQKQAFHEVALAKEAARQVEASRATGNVQAENYKAEIIDLKAVVGNLRMELQRSHEKAEDDIRKVQVEANENGRLREEAEEKNIYLNNELKKQRGVVESLQRKLQEAVEENRKVAEESSEATRRKLQALEEKEMLEEKLQANASQLNEREIRLSQLTTRLEALQLSLEDSKRTSEKAIERTTARLKEKEDLLAEALEKQKELRLRIEEQESRVLKLQSELTLALKKNLELSSSKENDQLESRALRTKLTETEAQLGTKQASIDTLKNKGDGLEQELSILKAKVGELQETMASLRTSLTDSQNKLAALTAASAADSCRTSAELQEAQNREKTIMEDISKKNELIEDLTSKLTAAVGRSAADSARAQAELSEALSREKSYQEELKQRKQMLIDLEDELMNLKSSNAFASANLEADLTEALSREENYRFELKRLKGIINALETKLEQEKETVQSLKAENQRGNHYGDASGSSTSILQGIETKTAAGMSANKAMAEVLGLGESLSSSNIRKLDVLEKITDARLLEMLVETKMQLALAEEEKLQLEHLIRRIRDGDKHVQQKLAQQAAKLEIKLTKANQMIDSMQDDRSRDLSRRESERSASSALARERSVMKGDQLQFFREQKRDKTSKPSTSKWRSGRTSKKSFQIAVPADEWDIGDDSHDEARSPGESQPRRSSSSASSTE